MMIKFVLLLLGLLLFPCVVSAYQINIDAPATLPVGKPLVVNGTTNFGIGTPIDVVLYYQLTTNTEVKRKIAYVQSDRTFRVVFDTTNLRKGTYKVEVPASGLGDSINTRIVELIDRSDEITLLLMDQEYSGALRISGSLQGNRNAGVQIEVTSPDGERIFGPQYIATSNTGSFAADVPIKKGGEYEVSFTDSDGFIGTRTITVINAVTVTTVPSATSGSTKLSAHATSSRDAPAYFEVRPGSSSVKVYTSSQKDWVMEYVDESGVLHTVNNHGELNPEEIVLRGKGKTLYFRVYPYTGSAAADVFLYAENAQSVRVSPTVPAVFESFSANPEAPAETESPVSPFTAGIALLAGIPFLRSRGML
jgi:hypothetical protein